jgi:hypothetical protein
MQALGASAVASAILYVDRELNGGRYSDIVVDVLKHVGWLIGIHA